MAQTGAFTACHQVFETAELAEHIFLNLQMQDLLVNVQRVCKLWQRIIFASPPLQQVLFLKPIPTQLVRCHRIGVCEYVDEDGKSGKMHPVKHPFLAKILGSMSAEVRKDKWSKMAYWRPEASWRRHLVSQPPMKSVDVHYWSQEDWKLGAGISNCQDQEVESDNGAVKLSDVVPWLSPPNMGAGIWASGYWHCYERGYQQLQEAQEEVKAFKDVV